MAVTFTDSGSSIRLQINPDYTDPNGQVITSQDRYIPKGELTIEAIGNNVQLFDGQTKMVFLYNDVLPGGGSAIAVAALIEAMKDTGPASSVSISSFPLGTETPSASVVTGSGASPVAAGKKSVTFTTDSSFAGTILGVARNPSTTYSFSISDPGKTLGAIAYTVTAGSMIIDVTV